MNFKPATREGVKPLIALYSESGCGKTFGALLLARGIAGPGGKIGMIDTESGRGRYYADIIPGGYHVGDLEEPFHPKAYIDAIISAEGAGLDVLIIDSMSHEWEGIGGVCEMAGDSETRTGKAGLHNWKGPKLEHQRLVQRLLRTKLAVICCIRAKHKSRQTKDDRGKTVIVKDDFTSPVQAEDFIFEMTAHAEILPDHTIHLTKCSHPDLRMCFPENGKEPLSIKHGEAIARWTANPDGAQSGATIMAAAASQPANKTTEDKLRDRIAEICQEGEIDDIQGFLIAVELMSDTETFNTLSADRLKEIGPKVRGKIAEILLTKPDQLF